MDGGILQRKESLMRAYDVQVLCRDYAGSIHEGWRPAVDGTLNQTGLPAVEASRCATPEEAESLRSFVITETQLSPVQVRVVVRCTSR